MSLDITCTAGNRQWHIGSKSPIAYTDVPKVTEVQADGDELGAIVATFKNLPCLTFDQSTNDNNARGYTMRWFGDDARFIVGNLSHLNRGKQEAQ